MKARRESRRFFRWLSPKATTVSRLATTPNQTLYSSTAYAPFGEPYKQSGTTDLSFTGQDQDTVSGMRMRVPDASCFETLPFGQ
jgi:hypothetical protein